MPPFGCVLNFTSKKQGLKLDPAFASSRFPEISFRRIPSRGVLTLYVLGHAAPNELKDGNRLVSEQTLADAIMRRRRTPPTLIVWDVCYSKSFRTIGDRPFQHWGKNFVHIFSSQAYERTWLGTGTGKPVSFFSTQLVDALKAGQRPSTWSDLEKRLRARFGNLQTPEIVSYNRSTPAQFALP